VKGQTKDTPPFGNNKNDCKKNCGHLKPKTEFKFN
jgi:hypothetical protein